MRFALAHVALALTACAAAASARPDDPPRQERSPLAFAIDRLAAAQGSSRETVERRALRAVLAHEGGALTERGGLDDGPAPGIGASILPGTALVSSVLEGGPAERAGLRPGDQVVSIGGAPVGLDDLIDLGDAFRGPVRSPVDLVVVRRDPGGPRLLSLRATRDVVESPAAITDARLLEEGIGYVRLPQRAGVTPPSLGERLEAAVTSLGRPPALILDLRGRAGLVQLEAVALAECFLPPATQLWSWSARGAGEPPARVATEVARPRPASSVFVLCDGWTGGQASMLATVLRRAGAAVLVGEPTRGPSAFRRLESAPEGEGDLRGLAIVYPFARYTLPDGAPFGPEKPDVAVACAPGRRVPYVDAKDDLALQAALEHARAARGTPR